MRGTVETGKASTKNMRSKAFVAHVFNAKISGKDYDMAYDNKLD